jgi:glycerol uptake facilitator protein
VDNLGIVFLSEIVGTAMLILLGCGVVANVALAKNKGLGGGFLMVTVGWGLAVFCGVIVAYNSGAHLNPAVTLGLVASGATEFGSGVPVNVVSVLVYIAGEFIGAILGAILVWLAYKQHFDSEPDPANKLGVFSTGPAIRSYGWNLVTEIIGTFVLVFVVIAFGGGRQGESGGLAALGALPVALLFGLVVRLGTGSRARYRWTARGMGVVPASPRTHLNHVAPDSSSGRRQYRTPICDFCMLTRR